MSEFPVGGADKHAFTPGFTGGLGDALAQAFGGHAQANRGFAPADLRMLGSHPRSFAPSMPAGDLTGGFDPIAAARAEGYADGLAAAQASDGRDVALAEQISQALSGRVDRDRVARQLRQTVLFLVAKIVGETGVAPDVLAGRIEAATELLSDAAESAMLRVHPDDVALLEGRLPATVFPVGDAAVARGSFVMESASTVVEDGPELWLDQLAAAIDRVAVPEGNA